MSYVLEVVDKTGRSIYLSKERWKHIRKDHPEVEDLEAIKNTLVTPIKLTSRFENKAYYYNYFKQRKEPEKYLLVIVKYLNGKGFVITAYYLKHT